MNTLRIGSTGPQVEFLQLALYRSGNDPGTIDGIFGANTQQALKNFQSQNGLTADGIAGPRTWSSLTPYMTGYIQYTIRRGDTFYQLAKRYGTDVSAIETANPSLDPFQLQIGTRIRIPLPFPVVPTNIRFTYTVLTYCIQGLQARYPFLEVGTSGKSVMGKNLYYLRLGTGENHVCYNAAHHANEWITTPLVLYYAEEFLQAVAAGTAISGLDAQTLYTQSSQYIIPMVNPDGVDLVTGELQSGNFYRQALSYANNYPDIFFPSGWKANIQGVDLNLQYPAGWEQAKEIKFAQGYVSPAPRDYVGTGPLTAPESLAMYRFTRQHHFRLTLSYHIQGQVIYWKFLDYLPPNSYEIGLQFSSASGYALETTPDTSGYAGYKDWFIQDYNQPGYTIEAGAGTNPLPLDQFAQIYRDNLGILALGAWVTI